MRRVRAQSGRQNSTTGALAAILIEPIQGTAGNVVPPPEFMPAVKDIARENDALLIADEMITGFGRTGRWFGCEHSGSRPRRPHDRQGPGLGLPGLGAGLDRRDHARAKPWGNPSGSSSSYGGNPMAGAAAYASVTVIEEEGLVENADRRRRVDASDDLKEMQERHEFIGDVQGKGLLIGVELVKDRVTREPLDARCAPNVPGIAPARPHQHGVHRPISA